MKKILTFLLSTSVFIFTGVAHATCEENEVSLGPKTLAHQAALVLFSQGVHPAQAQYLRESVALLSKNNLHTLTLYQGLETLLRETPNGYERVALLKLLLTTPHNAWSGILEGSPPVISCFQDIRYSQDFPARRAPLFDALCEVSPADRPYVAHAVSRLFVSSLYDGVLTTIIPVMAEMPRQRRESIVKAVQTLFGDVIDFSYRFKAIKIVSEIPDQEREDFSHICIPLRKITDPFIRVQRIQSVAEMPALERTPERVDSLVADLKARQPFAFDRPSTAIMMSPTAFEWGF